MLDEFDIRISFNAKGEVEAASYCDGDGCGHEREMPGNTTVNHLVTYHLSHYKTSHRVEPTKMCGYELPMPGRDDIVFMCNRDPHIGDDHELVKKRKRK